MADYHHTTRFTTYSPKLITAVDGFKVGSLICKVGGQRAHTFEVVGFDLAWNSKDYHPVVIVQKVGGSRRTKLHARELGNWTAA